MDKIQEIRQSWGMEREVVQFLGQSVEVRRRRFQKRLGVSVYPNGSIKVSANKSLSQKEILKFLQSNKSWLESSLQEARSLQEKYPPKYFRSGELYPYLGNDYQLRILKGDRVHLSFKEGEILFMSPTSEEDFSDSLRAQYFEAFKKSYRQVAEKIMKERLDIYSKEMGLLPLGLQIRGQKSIWGSCSPENKISLNFKLIVAPLDVIDYVIIHELAHITHKNHSKAFWNLVERHTEYRHFSKRWLKENQFKADFLNRKPELTS